MNKLINWLFALQEACEVCGGNKVIMCHCNENNEIICPNCMGKGVIEKVISTTEKIEAPCDSPACCDGAVMCGYCKGTGFRSANQYCSCCNGSGLVQCPTCKGVGRIIRSVQQSWVNNEICHICNGNQYISCYHCHGTKERICPQCKGKGLSLNKKKLALLSVVSLSIIAMPWLYIAIASIGLIATFVFYMIKKFPPTA